MLRGGLLILVLVLLLATPGLAQTEGERLFTRKGCVGCHVLKGHSEADGTMGPDLSKLYKAKPAFERSELAAFIRAPQATRPGTSMPAIGLTKAEAEAIAAYLLTDRSVAHRP